MDPYEHLFRPEEGRAKLIAGLATGGIHLMLLVAALLYVLPAPPPRPLRDHRPLTLPETRLPLPDRPPVRQERLPEVIHPAPVPVADPDTAEPIVEEVTLRTRGVDAPLAPDLSVTAPVTAPHPGAPDGPLTYEGVTTKPAIIASTRVEPDYPEVCRRVGAEGRVVLRVLIRKDGTVEPQQVLGEPRVPCGFTRAALEAVSQWRYLPGRQDGRAVDVLMTAVLDFRLD